MITHPKEIYNWFSEESLNDIMGLPKQRCEQIARAFLIQSGKRLRPFLAAGVCDSYFSSIPDGFKKIAVAVECFHKASLIHDDIQDGDAFRDGHATLHTIHGVPIAINVGDTLIHESYRLLLECNVPQGTNNRMLLYANYYQRRMCQGQSLDLDQTFHMQDMIELKTSSAFIVPLLFGAIYAGHDELTQSLISFGNYFGIMFQLADNIKDGDLHSEEMFMAYRSHALEARGEIKNDRLKKFLWDAVQVVVPENHRPQIVEHLCPATTQS